MLVEQPLKVTKVIFDPEDGNRLRKIILSGSLKRFGHEFNLAVRTPAEAIKALCTICKGFRQAMREGEYRIQRLAKNGEVDLPLFGLHMLIGDASIRIIPVMAGAKSGAWLVLAGVAIMAAAFIFAPAAAAGAGVIFGSNMGAAAFSLGSLATITYGNIAAVGLGLALMGVSQLLSPKPSVPDAVSNSTISGNVFGALQNVSAQGIPVPLLYGTSLEASILISAGMFAVQISVGAVPAEATSTLIVGS
jgi:predicted phage tail protein